MPSWISIDNTLGRTVRLLATLFALLGLCFIALVASRLTDCAESLGVGQSPSAASKSGASADLERICSVNTEKAEEDARERSTGVEAESAFIDAETKCACRVSALQAHRVESTILSTTTIAFSLLALLVAWRARRESATATFALFASVLAYGYGFHFFGQVTYEFRNSSPLLLVDPLDAPVWGTVADALAILAWIVAPLLFVQFTRRYPVLLSDAQMMTPVQQLISKSGTLRTDHSYAPSIVHLVIVWVGISWTNALLSSDISDTHSTSVLAHVIRDGPYLLVGSAVATTLLSVVLELYDGRREGSIAARREARITLFLLAASVLVWTVEVAVTTGDAMAELYDGARLFAALMLVRLLAVYLRKTLALSPSLIAFPLLVHTGLLLALVEPQQRDYGDPAVLFGFCCFLAGAVNLVVAYRYANLEQRRSVRWMALGFWAAAALLLVGPLYRFFMPVQERICLFLDACRPPITPSFFAFPALAAFLCVALFYRGELDARLVLWRGTVYGLVAIGTATIFGLVEHVLAHYMSAILFVGASPTIAACVSAVAIKPIKDGCERFVVFAVRRITSSG